MIRDCGVVLVHGKWATQPFEHAPLAASLVAQGYAIREPVMPWALHRRYDRSFDRALEELEESMAELRAAGCRQVIVCGHSLGACAALGLAARGGNNIDGLVLLAPGHFPERLAAQGLTTASLARARQAFSTGETHRIALTDINQGIVRRLRVGAAAWLSYFEPEGPAQWPANARAMSTSVPTLVVTGCQEVPPPPGIDYAFGLMPHHPSSRYVEIDASHADTPRHAAELVRDWMDTLEPDSPP